MSRPPFHADQVGSLLRPAELREARAKAKAGSLPAEALRAVENRAIERAALEQVQARCQLRFLWALLHNVVDRLILADARLAQTN